MYVTKRVAIDWFGRLGSLYDAYRDQVLGLHNESIQGKSSESHDILCKIVHGNKEQNQNILQMINIDDELRLSTVLNLRKKNGVAAIADYSAPINEYTRLFCYSHVNRTQKLPEDPKDIPQIINRLKSQTQATHIITGVDWGIHIVVVLQLPMNPDRVTEIDRVLQQFCTFLLSDLNITSVNRDKENIFSSIVQTKVYSNIPDLNSKMTLGDVCRYIEQSRNSIVDQPVSYTLRPITWLYPQYTGEGATYVPLSASLNCNVELYILEITENMKRLDPSANEGMPTGHLRELLSKIQKQWLDAKAKFAQEIERFSKLVLGVRNGKIKMSKIDEALKDNEQMMIRNVIRHFTQILNDLKQKAHFINDLGRSGFQYFNAVEQGIDQTDTETTIEGKLITNDQHDRTICSNDLLNGDNPEQLRKLRKGLLEEHKNNSKLHLIYADFSYSSFELHQMMILPSSKYDNEKNTSMQKATSSSREMQHSATAFTNAHVSISTSAKVEATIPLSMKTQMPAPMVTKVDSVFPSSTQAQPSTSPLVKKNTDVPSLSTTDTINILLLGETGVGKTTFINAFVNYLTFKTFAKAQTGKPIVVIPVSFLMTAGDNFKEHTIKFGSIDSSHSEDFDHPGQSVTQRCKSYVYPLKNNEGRQLRIIDTPGFGDTRGLDQDDRNMQHILEYINNLSHLNAICFLLKPNASRLDISFRTCLTQLFGLLGPNARNTIIFCFTNARSTFYTPGDTAPLIKKTLNSFTISDIPFKKENTFCFDNESFRYLVALQNNVQFNDMQKGDYENSWSTSVTQANHLIDYICKKCNGYRMDGEFQSIKHAQLEITHMIRPMLEAMRNILRNLILRKISSFNESIELYPKPTDRPVTLCLSCESYPRLVGKFLIGEDIPHEVHRNCRKCRCPLNQHVPTYYVLEYRVSNSSPTYDEKHTTSILNQLYRACAEFSHFLMHVVSSAKDDPFLIGLVQMIMEENHFCNNQVSNCLNPQLVNALRDLHSKYEHEFNEIIQRQKHSQLSDIYNLINIIGGEPMVNKQMTAYKEGQRMVMKLDDFEISTDSTNA